MVKLSEAAKAARREYQKQWRQKQGAKRLQEYQARYCEKKAEQEGQG